MRLFQAALDTCLDSPFFASLSVHGLHFTVYAPSRHSLGYAQFSGRLTRTLGHEGPEGPLQLVGRIEALTITKSSDEGGEVQFEKTAQSMNMGLPEPCSQTCC